MTSYDKACNNSGYFDTSDFLSTSLHYFGCLAIPVHLFGAYCIIFQTPQTMKSVKFSLLNFHFWTCFLDFGCSSLATPYVFIPALAGYPLGLLTYFGVGTAEQAYIMLSVSTLVAVSIIGLFENRFYILMTNSRCWWHTRKLPYIFNHLSALTCFLISYVKVPDQKMALEFMKMFIRCIPPWVLIPGTICFILYFAQIVMFPVLTNRILKRHLYLNMSDNTAKLQKSFQRALICQVTLPVIVLMIPFAYIGLSSWLWYHNQAFNNITFIIISSHGFFSTISMIVLHSAYREFTMSLFWCSVGSYDKSSGKTAMGLSVIT